MAYTVLCVCMCAYACLYVCLTALRFLVYLSVCVGPLPRISWDAWDAWGAWETCAVINGEVWVACEARVTSDGGVVWAAWALIVGGVVWAAWALIVGGVVWAVWALIVGGVVWAARALIVGGVVWAAWALIVGGVVWAAWASRKTSDGGMSPIEQSIVFFNCLTIHDFST